MPGQGDLGVFHRVVHKAAHQIDGTLDSSIARRQRLELSAGKVAQVLAKHLRENVRPRRAGQSEPGGKVVVKL